MSNEGIAGLGGPTVYPREGARMKLRAGSMVTVGRASWKIVRVNKKTVTVQHRDLTEARVKVDTIDNKYVYLDDMIKAMGIV